MLIIITQHINCKLHFALIRDMTIEINLSVTKAGN